MDKEKNTAFQKFRPDPTQPDPLVDPTRIHPWSTLGFELILTALPI